MESGQRRVRLEWVVCPGGCSRPLMKLTRQVPSERARKGRKVPSQLIHDLEGLPHVGRVDGHRPPVLLVILGLRCGLRARLDAVNRKEEGEMAC